jgi:DNA polymerase-3 subunit gamma/tau
MLAELRMAYLVLARKYRPQTFAEIVGQDHVTRTLANAFDADRVHHAFLFCGPRGVGKTTAARVLGKALNCERGISASPCGECSACQTITGGTAVDYFEMDGASNRGIDAIRELTDAVRYQPAVLRKKVYVIDEVHMLTTEAFNALLKTLEEPPPHVTFVMATTEPHKVPNTILSRCQRFDFKLVPRPRLVEHLTSIVSAEGVDIEPGAIELLVRESGGSVRDALSLADQVISYAGAGAAIGEARVAEVLGVADRSLTRALVGALSGGDVQTALVTAADAIGRGVDEVQLARAIVRHLRDLAVLLVARDAPGLVVGSADERAAMAREADEIGAPRLRQMFDRMLRACEDLGDSQQPRLILDFALIDVAAQEPALPLGDLLERLADLERRLAGKGGQAVNPSSGGSRRPEKTDERPARPPRPIAAAGSTATEKVRSELPPIPPPDAPPPAPPAPAPPARMPATVEGSSATAAAAAPGDMLAAWERVIIGLEESRQLALAGLYQNAKVLAWTEDSIEVGFPEGSMTAEVATEAAKIEEMREFLAKQRGRSVSFSVKLLSGAELEAHSGARSILDASRERRESEQRRLEGEARTHPTTKVVLETFGAEIKEIKTDV